MNDTSEKINVSWDLSPFFKTLDDPNIQETIKKVHMETDKFVKDYKDNINTPKTTHQDIRSMLKRQEAIITSLYGPLVYANLKTAANMGNKKALGLLNTVKKVATEVEKKLAFVDLELGELLEKRGSEFLDVETLKTYKHHLERILRQHQYSLSEEQEQLVLDKDLYGSKAFSSLQSETLSNKEFEVEIKGEKKTISWSEAQGMMSSPDREVRKAVILGTMHPLQEDQELYAACLRNICGNHLVDCEHRDFESPMTSSLIKNDITQEMIDKLFAAIEDNLDIYHEVIKYKAGLFETEKLHGYDLWAPHPKAAKKEISWDKAKQLVLDTYQDFDFELFEIISDMFESNRIDATPKLGKRGGAFCSSDYYSGASFIMMSFNGTMDNVQTLAHELGHAVHGNLVYTKQPYFNSKKSMCLAEVASEFGRFLLVDKLMHDELDEDDDDVEKKETLLFDHLEGLCTTIFEVGSRTKFETSLYDAIQSGKYLNGELISNLFEESRMNYFGDNMEFLDDQAFDWIWKPHYFMPGLRYYNYPYVFAECLVLAMFQKYKQEGKKFIPKLKKFLAAGSERSPQELAQEIMGVDLTSEDFWQLAFTEMRTLLEELKAEGK